MELQPPLLPAMNEVVPPPMQLPVLADGLPHHINQISLSVV
jgi:hypothetical protein